MCLKPNLKVLVVVKCFYLCFILSIIMKASVATIEALIKH
jgi:uncharacterized membrane protein